MLSTMLVVALGAALVLSATPSPPGDHALDGGLGGHGHVHGHWAWTGVGVCPHYCTCFRSHGLRRVECAGRRLIGVKLGLPPDTEAADLRDNVITTLDHGCFQELGLVQLRELNLRNNAIHEVNPWAFAGLRRLRFLDLSNNHLQNLYLNTFAANRGLKTLLLAGNNLARVPSDQPLIAASRLQVLDLSNCKLAHVGASFFAELPALASLNLSANYLIQLQPQTVARQWQLQLLDLSRNPLACDINTRRHLQLLGERNVTVQHSCPAPAAQGPSKHLARLLADVLPSGPSGPSPGGHNVIDDQPQSDSGATPRRTHEAMVLGPDLEPSEALEVPEAEYVEEDVDDTETNSSNETPPRGDCPPLFPERNTKNPIMFKDWFDPIPSFWAAIFGGWVGFVMGLVLSSCACHLSFWRALCSGSTPSSPSRNRNRNRRRARLSLELPYPDLDWDVAGLCPSTSTSGPALLRGSPCSSTPPSRSETPPPAYNDLLQTGFAPLP